MSVSDKVLDAIQILTKSYIRKAGYDRTIQAQIVSCEDATIGKYRCRYQDAIIYAYSNSADVTYTKGSSVYILVPGNDMTKEKTILGSTEKLGINYISQAEGDQAYNIIGNNCITSNQKLYLDTNNKNYKYTIYSQQSNNNIITIDTDALNHYIKQSSSLIVGATFKTSIPQDRQVRGHYGITYNLKFLDNTSNREVIRSYTVDEDNMVNNPYRLLYDTRQYEIFDIDGANFISLESIEIFNKDFPKAESNITEEVLITGDIEISALELYGAVRMTQEEINGVAISFYTPQGTFFIDGSTSASYKTITAQVRIKGKLASAAQNIPFYWGIENAGISTQSEYYNKYLGRGWKCLNNKNIIEPQTETQAAIVEWVPSIDTYIVKFNQATAKNNKFKVAAVYDENVITKQINIENLTSTLNLTIESNDGTKFYYDVGHPTLTCKVNGEQLANYTYLWAYESNTGLFENLPQTTDLNTEYNAAVAALQELQTAIAAGTKFANAEADNLNALQTAIKQYKFIQRVQGNKIYDVQINHITNFGTFKCSVYNEQNIYCGTCSITLTNSLQSEDLYSLVINNGAVTFQYNENGVAPNNKSLDIQQQIQALSFTVYDNLGKPIDSDIIANDSNCQIRWAIPIKNTMLVDKQDSESSSGTDETETYRYYDNIINLVYDIAQRYNVNNSRNQIQLTVDYKGMSLTAETDFTFVKQGEPGTNGTEYIVKLIPNTKMSNPPLWPMITTRSYQISQYFPPQSINILNYSINGIDEQEQLSPYVSRQFFKAQLWHNGELVWQGASVSEEAIDNLTKPESIYWEVLQNKYNSSSKDASHFSVVDANSGLFQYAQTTPFEYDYDIPYANIIKCSITWQGKTYYGTIPIITAWIYNENVRVSLKDYTGWRYAIYTNDGVLPQYDNANPFEFLIKEKINNIWEDVSLIQDGDHVVEYTFNSIGNYRDTGTGSTINANLIQILNSPVYTKDCQKNQIKARPASRYDGVCVNAAIVCTYERNNSIIGKICVPIHFLLNRYGLAQINDWDGNSIQIDNDGGFILSPQMGAGSKNSSNQFTGVLMGEVREAGKSSSNTGLFGYSEGARSFFLNSQNGSALFGKYGNGQIILDPNSDLALLYSNNFWKSYDTQTGLPINYRASNEAGAGLLIDLTTPSIRYGNGKFSVSNQGILHAEEANISGAITASSLSLGQGVSIAGTNITGVLKSSNYDSSEGEEGFYANLATGEIKAKSLEISIGSAANAYTDSKISATAQEIRSEMTSISKVGVNLLRYTADLPVSQYPLDWYAMITATNSTIETSFNDSELPPIQGIHRALHAVNPHTAATTIWIGERRIPGFKVGQNYSYGVWIRASEAGHNIAIWPLYNNAAVDEDQIPRQIVGKTTTEWTYYKLEGNTLEGTQREWYMSQIGFSSIAPDGWVEICAPKLEVGDFATQWSASPIDSMADIGGTNLLRRSGDIPINTTESEEYYYLSNQTKTSISDTDTNFPVSGITRGVRITNTTEDVIHAAAIDQRRLPHYKAGEIYSQGCWIRSNIEGLDICLQALWSSNTQKTELAIVGKTKQEWTYYKLEGKRLIGDQSETYLAGYVYVMQLPVNAWFEVCAIKVEKGNVATDWSPNPDDYQKYVADNYSTITQTASQISSAVTSVKSYTDTAIDNVQIGATNLLRYTADMSISGTSHNWRASGGTVSISPETTLPVQNVNKALRITNTSSSAARVGCAQDRIPGFVASESYTQSCWIRASVAGLDIQLQPLWDPIGAGQATGAKYIGTTTTSWQYVKVEGLVNSAEQQDYYSAGYVYVDNVPANGWFEICAIKVEQGNKATAWSPNPEDYNIYTDNAVRSNLQVTTSQISQLSDRVTSTVTTVNNIQKNMLDTDDVNALIAAGNFATSSSVSQTSSALQVQITQAQNTANAANSAAQTITTGVTVDADGVTVGKSNSAVKGVFSNNSLQFKSGGKTVAWLSASSEEGLGVDTIQIGKQNTANQRWIISTSSDGSHLSFTRHQ